MSERFVRCPHCRLPHNVETTLCPVTNKPIALSERKSDNGRSASPSLSPPPIVPKRAADSCATDRGIEQLDEMKRR